MGFSLGKVLKPVGSLLNGITGVTDTANESYKASKRLMNMENANNIALWNMQNEYNTPAAQIARMKEAGIDVNPMTYAVGNGNMSTTASSVSTATPHMPVYSGAGNPITTLMGVLHGIKDLEYKQKQIDNYEHDHASPFKDISDVLRKIFTPKNGKSFLSFISTKYPSVGVPSKTGNPKVDKKIDNYSGHKFFYDNFQSMY